MRERALTIAAVLVTVVAVGVALYEHSDRTGPNAKARSFFGGRDGSETIQDPDKVEAFRLAAPPSHPEPPAALEDYSVAAGPIDVPPTSARSLSTLLLSERSYSFEGPKSCLPTFGVRITFLRGNDEFEVNFCFDCALAYVRRNGKPFSGFDFDPSSRQFAALIRPLFPDDPEIQALP